MAKKPTLPYEVASRLSHVLGIDRLTSVQISIEMDRVVTMNVTFQPDPAMVDEVVSILMEAEWKEKE